MRLRAGLRVGAARNLATGAQECPLAGANALGSGFYRY